jgi:glycerol-3-phosphate acyltransferase PlsY
MAKWWFADLETSGVVLSLVVLAVFIGHIFPVFHRFQGGKGVATACGILFGINLWLGLAALSTWLIIAFFFRYSSLAALIIGIFAPFYYFLLFGSQPICISLTCIGALLIWRHQKNIRQLLAGTESRIGQKDQKN